jgi:DNA-binding transcriptional LysR family regulator
MNTEHLDLDQLLVFDALLRDRSITAVARRLGLPQPTVSRWLADLRRFFNDPLFVRTRRGMEPTPVALGAAEAVHEIVHLYRVRLLHGGGFDPARSERNFAIAASDVGHLLVLPLLERCTAESAPGLTFTAVPLDRRPLIEALESGEVDIAVGGFPALFAGVREQVLFRERYVCLVRTDHPLCRGGTLSRAAFKAARHVVVAAQAMGHVHHAVEKRLLEMVPADRVRITSQSFLLAALFVEQSDLVLTVPSGVARLFPVRGSVETLPPPLDLPVFEVKQYWHERFHHDPGHAWLRRTVAQSLAVLSGP